MKTLRSYGLLATMELEAVKAQMLFVAPVQLLLTGGLAIGLGFLIPNIDSAAAQYLCTGAPTVSVLLVGLVVLPQTLSVEKQTGTADFMRALPVPSSARLLASLTPHLVLSLPGALLALLVAAWYFDFSIDPNPLALVALGLVALTGAAMGNAVASLSGHPLVTTIVTNVMLFFVMLFSPINFPVERLPDWLQRAHDVLPFQAMGAVVRGTLVGQSTASADWLRIGVWAAVCFLLSTALSARRS